MYDLYVPVVNTWAKMGRGIKSHFIWIVILSSIHLLRRNPRTGRPSGLIPTSIIRCDAINIRHLWLASTWAWELTSVVEFLFMQMCLYVPLVNTWAKMGREIKSHFIWIVILSSIHLVHKNPLTGRSSGLLPTSIIRCDAINIRLLWLASTWAWEFDSSSRSSVHANLCQDPCWLCVSLQS